MFIQSDLSGIKEVVSLLLREIHGLWSKHIQFLQLLTRDTLKYVRSTDVRDAIFILQMKGILRISEDNARNIFSHGRFFFWTLQI